jgi:hypothetical protein
MAMTPKQVNAQQKADAARGTAEKTAAQKVNIAKLDTPAASVPAVATKLSVPVGGDGRSFQQNYVDFISPSTIAGKLVKFSKAGEFVINETDEVIDPEKDFIAMCDEVLIGWIKFNDDAPPDRHQGLLYDNFVMPARETLGDLDQAKWPIGLSGQPTDVWQHQICLVLMEPGTNELFTYATTSITGRRAVGSLLRHYDRLQKSHPDHYPVVKLKTAGFQHRDERIGFVPTPSFAVVGHAPKTSAAVPDTSPAGDLDDAIPF